MSLKIDVYLAEICGSYHQLRQNIDQAIAELGIQADVAWHTTDYDDAVSRNIKGSPSVWINGEDAFEGGTPGIL
ncbi:MAG TPA: thioredoxin family protein [Nitrospirota bacterium]|nr:thioredoxin family protein [Nitrospirota bacterium]